jgi:16S rRNA G966 N2-methylase RsmD/DNA-directed RNA polymerase subunit RPC12/RpoP
MQASHQDQLFNEFPPKKQGPVECLGTTFENDNARRAYFTERLREKLQDPAFRKIEGFPRGEDEDILRLSDPPYYTVCPNPFLPDFLYEWQGKSLDADIQSADVQPFAKDVSAGNYDPLYQALSYHTKVPPNAIIGFLKHFCPANGVVFDGFCGSGMVGLAARLAGRKAVLVDLAPAATAISGAHCLPIDTGELRAAARGLVNRLIDECGSLYEVVDEDTLLHAEVDYVIWSEQYRCTNCLSEFLFTDAGFDFNTREPRTEIRCPYCDAMIENQNLERCLDHTGRTIEKPVRVKYLSRKRISEHDSSQADLDWINHTDAQPIPYVYPDDWMMHIPPSDDGWGTMWRRGYHSGMWKVSDFFYNRTLWVLAAALQFIEELDISPNVRFFLRTTVINQAPGMTRMRRAYQGILPLVLYIPRMRREVNAIRAIEGKLEQLVQVMSPLPAENSAVISTQSSTSLTNIPDMSIDYIFTDPPFGSNIIYSEVNFIWESLLKAFTVQSDEAIIDSQQKKGLSEYQALMTDCFKEFFRILKPGRWMTVEFHNSKNSIWNAIQDGLQAAGFVVADVRVLDKEHESFKQAVAAGAVKQDLVISAYKPSADLEREYQLHPGSSEAAWEFAREHLGRLPVFVEKEGQMEVVAERQNFLIFDRMVAFHIKRQIAIPLSAQQFYAGLVQRFPERDGMFFLNDQVAIYDHKRANSEKPAQLPLLVTNEANAILWLRRQLEGHPQTLQEIHPEFMRELAAWQKNEKSIDLADLLKENYLVYNGSGTIPEQIWNWMSQDAEFKERIKVLTPQAPDELIQQYARDRWYVPDPNRAQDLEKLRERSLLREFERYLADKEKMLKVFRLEAIQVGFKDAWKRQDYKSILAIAAKIPEDILQDDPKLLMWYDQALTRSSS